MTEEEELREFYNSERGERDYYTKQINFKGMKDKNLKPLEMQVRLPMTKDGCETVLEMVTQALELPLNNLTRQCFAGWVHSIPKGVNTFTFADLGKTLWRQKSIDATWLLDQDTKEARKLAKEAESKQTEATTTLTLAKDEANESTEVAPVQ